MDISDREDQKLDKLYVCQKCHAAYLFYIEVREHMERDGHLEFVEIPI